jgi:hypothetical protein
MFKKLLIAVLVPAIALILALPVLAGQVTNNGWYKGEEIYYIDRGVEEGVNARGENDIYVIGSIPRGLQPQVVEFIPGDPGYSPHWNVNLVHTAEGKTVQNIVDAGYASDLYPDVLFDDVGDILAAEGAGLVVIVKPGVVVNCPIISKKGAEAPGHTQAPEDFPDFQGGDTF